MNRIVLSVVIFAAALFGSANSAWATPTIQLDQSQVNDGLSWFKSPTFLDFGFRGVAQSSARVCWIEGASASGCSTTTLVPWQVPSGAASSTPPAGSRASFLENVTYSFCIAESAPAQLMEASAVCTPFRLDGGGATGHFTAQPAIDGNFRVRASWMLDSAPPSGFRGFEACIYETSSTFGSCRYSTMVKRYPAGSSYDSGLTSIDDTFPGRPGVSYKLLVMMYSNNGSGTMVLSQPVIAPTVTPPSKVSFDLSSSVFRSHGGIMWFSDASQVGVGWNGTAATNPIRDYQICWTVAANGSDCDTSPYGSWQSIGLSTLSYPPLSTQTMMMLGGAYLQCVRAVDTLGFRGASACVRVGFDSTQAPAATGSFALTATRAHASWKSTATNPSSVRGYSYCISESSSGMDCDTSAVITFEDDYTQYSSTTRSFDFVPSQLRPGHRYYVWVRTVTHAGLAQTSQIGDAVMPGQLVDSMPPSDPVLMYRPAEAGEVDHLVRGAYWTDGDIQYQWTASVDETDDAVGYEYCISSVPQCGGTPAQDWKYVYSVTDWRDGNAYLYPEGVNLYPCVRAFDAAGNRSQASCSVIPVVRDSTVPDATQVAIDDFSITANTASASWTAPAATFGPSGSGGYEYCITTNATVDPYSNCDGGAVVPFGNASGYRDVQLSSSFEVSGLSLTPGVTYYLYVRVYQATNAWMNTSPTSATI